MTWYNSGFAGVNEAAIREQRERETKRNMPLRFFVGKGETANVVFCDDQAFSFDEHKIQPPGPDGWRHREFKTCKGRHNGCMYCATGSKAVRSVAFTIIDKRIVKKDDGKVYRNQKRLLILRADVAAELGRRSQSWGGLKHREVAISRIGDISPATGNFFDVVRDSNQQPKVLNIEAVNSALIQSKREAIDFSPYNYIKILAPDPAIEPAHSNSSTSAFGNFLDEPSDTIEEPSASRASTNQSDVLDDDVPF